MKDTDWKILHELYRSRNITRAASLLYMTQPALTKRLQIIEQEFGVEIVVRGKYGVVFTPAGEYLAKCAEKQVLFMEEVIQKLNYLQNEQKGILIIGTSYSFSRYSLPEILSRYKEQYPWVELELVCMESNKLVQMMSLGQLHVCFVRGEYECSASQARLSDEQGYILSKEPISLDNLPEQGKIVYDIGKASQEKIDRWWNERYQQKPNISMTTTFIDNAWQMVRQGMGYTICFLSPEQSENMDLYKYPMVDLLGNMVKRTTCFLYQKDELQPEYIKNFIRTVLNIPK